MSIAKLELFLEEDTSKIKETLRSLDPFPYLESPSKPALEIGAGIDCLRSRISSLTIEIGKEIEARKESEKRAVENEGKALEFEYKLETELKRNDELTSALEIADQRIHEAESTAHFLTILLDEIMSKIPRLD